MDPLHNFLVESIKQDDGLYRNVINASHPNPCGICQKNVSSKQKAILCTSCLLWVHIKCNNTPAEDYNSLLESNSLLSDSDIDKEEWHCNKCILLNRAQIFPFGLESTHDLNGIMLSETMEAFEKLPKFEIVSKALNIDSLKNHDLDENIINNINSKYYSVREFQKLKNDNSFKIFHSNLNGLEHKFQLLHNFINTPYNFDIINISETSQTENQDFITNIDLEGYTKPFTTGSRSARGGVAIYVKNNINVIEREDLNQLDDNFEAMWVEIINDKTKNIICGCFYRHPNTDIDYFTNYVSKCLTKISKEKKECYLSGDYNIDLLKYDTSNKHSDFLNTLTSFGYLPHIHQPTRITEDTATVIDNIYGNNFVYESISGNILYQMADHLIQFLYVCRDIDKITPIDIYQRDYSKFNDQSFLDDISIQNWNVETLEGTNHKFNDFLWRLEECVDRHAPIKKLNKKKIKNRLKPWINAYILKMISHRDKLFHKKKKNPLNLFIKNAYNLFRNRITRELKKAKKAYFKEFFENNLNNMKKTWKGIKDILNLKSKSGSYITQLMHEGKTITNNGEMANIFNNFFINIGSKLDEDIPNSNRIINPGTYLKDKVIQSLLLSPSTPQEIYDIIGSLDESKSTGNCTIPTKLIKLAKHDISIPFNEICNSSFAEGIFPDKNKIAKVIPSFKKGSTKDVNNYRPISLLSIFSKIMEKLMATRLNDFFELHSIICPNQFGFRAGFSTSHSLISITENIKKTIEEKKFGCGVFIDLKKAFDTVNHNILLQKLEHYGIRDIALSWFRSYLTNRKQFVMVNGTDSATQLVTCGVPQGSVLGPLLFLIYINDLPNISSKLKFFLFADDTNIYLESDDLMSLEKTMNRELKKLYDWLCVNRLSLNISKTNFVLCHAINKITSPITIIINKKSIEQVKYVKYLGVLIDAQLTFRYHIDELNKKISRAIGILYKLRPFVTTKIITNVYYAIVYPFLLYGVIVWGTTSKTLLTPIHILQKKFVRMSTFNDNYPIIPGPLAHTPPLFHQLNILTIFDIFKLQLGIFVYENINGIGPLNSIMQFNKTANLHDHATRYATQGNLFLSYARTSRYGLNSLKFSGGKLWSTIPKHIQDSRSKRSFNKLYKKELRSYYLE